MDTGKGEVRVSEERLEEVRVIGRELVREQGRVRVRDVASFAGKLMSIGHAVKPVCWFTRALYALIGVTVHREYSKNPLEDKKEFLSEVLPVPRGLGGDYLVA